MIKNSFIKKHWQIITILLITFAIILIHFSSDRAIMGLDNASPYFNPSAVFHNIKGIGTFIYGGLTFTLPIFAFLKAISIPPEIQSQLYVFSMFALGAVGTAALSSFVISKITPKNKSPTSQIIPFLVSTFSLVTVWILAHPNFLFLAAYGSIPWVVYSILKIQDQPKNKISYIVLAAATLFFLTTSLNLVACGSYLIQIVILAAALTYITTKTKFLKALKTPIIWAAATTAFLFLTLQLISLANGDKSFIGTNFVNYINSLTSNSTITEVSADLQESEYQATLLDNIRFANGWMELHDIDNNPVFNFYDLYKENSLYILLGTLPFILAIISVAKPDKKNSKTYVLFIILSISILLSSGIFVRLISNISYLGDAFRWPSSKLWPTYLIPIAITASLGFYSLTNKLDKQPKHVLTAALVILMVIYGAPLFSKHLFSSHVKVEIPSEYLRLEDRLDPDSKVLYLPQPQKLYFRQYDWGYYGSDFLSYLVNAEIIDRANLYEHGKDYDDYIEILNDCKAEDLDYVIYDKTVASSQDYEPEKLPDCLDSNFKLILSNRTLNIYERR